MRLFGVCFGHQIICKALFEVRIPLEATDTVYLLLSAPNTHRLLRRMLYLKIPLFAEIPRGGKLEFTPLIFRPAFLLGLGRWSQTLVPLHT